MGMSPIIAVLLASLLASCAGDEPRLLSSPEDTSWIQPGITTRQEVVKQLGEPTSSAQLLTSEMVRYGASPERMQPSSVPSVVATPRGYMSVESPPVLTLSVQDRILWIRFDEHGIVNAFGHDEPAAK
jgi:outer membrane protein assembly factor BamE (lipoprotein component of BamABCDE complex)